MRRDVSGSMEKTRTRSAPRSGTTMNFSVGSRRASCGCGDVCLPAGSGPGADILKVMVWSGERVPSALIACVVSPDPLLLYLLV